MARKLFIAYFVYVAVVFLFNSYIMNYADAIIKAVISGVIFTGIYAILLFRAEKREKEKK
jgi:uncharacterized membrane protein (GlpM family)